MWGRWQPAADWQSASFESAFMPLKGNDIKTPHGGAELLPNFASRWTRKEKYKSLDPIAYRDISVSCHRLAKFAKLGQPPCGVDVVS